MPAVSVVVPAYNAAAFLEETVDSVRRQSFRDWELILVDDGSTDATPAIIQRLVASDDRIRALRQDNRGIGAARNLGIANSSGEWIALLDSDDLFLPAKLQRQLAAAGTHECDVIFGAVELVGDVQRRSYVKWFGKTREFTLSGAEGAWRMIGHNFVPLSTALVRRDLLSAVGGFTERRDLLMVEDFQIWLRLLAHGAAFHYLPQADTKYRVHAGNGGGQDRMQMKRSRIAALTDVPMPFWLCDLRRRVKILELQCGLVRHWLRQRTKH